MEENANGIEGPFPQPRGIVLHARLNGGRGIVREVPAIVLEVQSDGTRALR
jgi:hypothetical protein